MRNRFIIVPKDKIAEESLDFDTALQSQLIELFLKEEDFSYIIEAGIIELINTQGLSNIDDFEDDFVRGQENLDNVINALLLIFESIDNKTLLQSIINIFIEAKIRDTGVYFYF
jgi:hypothetical protein